MDVDRSIWIAALALLATALPLRAQVGDGDPGAMAQEAERLLRTGANEDATLLARAARAELAVIGDDNRRELLRSGIDSLLARCDPLFSRHVQRDSVDAKELVELARGYLRKRLPRRAAAILEDALELDREAVEPVLAYAQKQIVTRKPIHTASGEVDDGKPSAGSADHEPKLHDLIGEIVPRVAWGTWALEKTEVRSPHLEGNTAYLIAKEPQHKDNRISVDVMIGDVDGSAALVFGGIDASTYYILEILHQTDQGTGRYTNLSIHQIANTQAKEIARIAFDLTAAQRAGWLTISVSIRGRALSAGLGGRSNLRCTAPTDPYGGVGFFVTGNSPNTVPVRFRRLLIEPLPVDEPAPAPEPAPTQVGSGPPKPASADPVAAAIRAVLDSEPGDDTDARLVSLHALWSRLVECADDHDGDVLAVRLGQTVAAIDPLAKQDREVRRARATRRVDEARAYRDGKFLRLAAASLREASRFEPDAGADLRAELAVALAPPPPATLPVALDCEVLDWFDGGETLLGSAGWLLGPKGARCPLDSTAEDQVLAGKRAQPEIGTIRADVILPADDGARAGIAFEVRSAHDLAFAIVDREQGRLRVSVVRSYAGNYTVYGTRLGAAATQGEPACGHLELAFDQGKASITLAGATALEFRLADRAATPRLGLFATVPGEPASFRNFKVEVPSGK